MPKEKQAPKELKVTDKRIFTPEGEIREEFRQEINPAEPQVARAEPQTDRSEPQTTNAEPPPAEPANEPVKPAERRQEQKPVQEERRRSIADKAANPNTPFTNFIEPLIAQAYMSLGMLRNPYQPQAKIDTAAARQMIEILTLLKEKTHGNLDPDEDDFLDTHLGELKLAFVQRTKTI
ncbi:MAG TPA: DUF1844 domain-containing protein [Thermoanaerobaculia bacterium]|nr:DUF1844 domain-containing protein [Thermoanaerobaculia bacterium]